MASDSASRCLASSSALVARTACQVLKPTPKTSAARTTAAALSQTLFRRHAFFIR